MVTLITREEQGKMIYSLDWVGLGLGREIVDYISMKANGEGKGMLICKLLLGLNFN